MRRTIVIETAVGGTQDRAAPTHSPDLALGVAMEDLSLFEWRLAPDRRLA